MRQSEPEDGIMTMVSPSDNAAAGPATAPGPACCVPTGRRCACSWSTTSRASPTCWPWRCATRAGTSAPPPTASSALRAAREFRPDAVVLDVMLPDIDGIELLRRLRAEAADIPVLFLTAKDAVEDRVAGLTAGGDDYVTKPFSLEEVVARLRGLIRRTKVGDRPRRGAARRSATSTLDEDSHEVHRAGEKIALTATEFELLRYLMRNPRRVLSKAQILDRVWNYDFGGQANVVELYISYLRKKIDAGPFPDDPHPARRRVRHQAGRMNPGAEPSGTDPRASGTELAPRRGSRAARLGPFAPAGPYAPAGSPFSGTAWPRAGDRPWAGGRAPRAPRPKAAPPAGRSRAGRCAARMLAGLLALLAGVSLIIGVASVVALRSYLVGQLDSQLESAATRSAIGYIGGRRAAGAAGQAAFTIYARVADGDARQRRPRGLARPAS